jgi:aspartate dehydrogenase
VSEAARAGATRFILPAGAIGGIDILSALKASGIQSVAYTGRKPPRAWKDTPAEALHDLDTLTTETVLFSGNAREAAIQYPKNANVAATIAAGWPGFRANRCEAWSCRSAATGNVHEYSVRSSAAEFTVRIEGKPSPDNPKTSVATVYSVAREVFNRCREQAI